MNDNRKAIRVVRSDYKRIIKRIVKVMMIVIRDNKRSSIIRSKKKS